MVTLQGAALITESIAAICLIAALAGFGIRHSKPWLIGAAAAFAILIVAATVMIELSA